MEFVMYFDKVAERSYRCILPVKMPGMIQEQECGDFVMVSKCSFWNLKRHICQKHENVLRQHCVEKVIGEQGLPALPPQQQRRRRGQQALKRISIRSKRPCQSPILRCDRKRKLDQAFFKMIYMDYEPLDKGEHKGMQHFTRVVQPGYTLPCYKTVRDTLLPHALEEMESKLRNLLQKGDGFALSVDIWTSKGGHNFLGIVASFIDAAFRGHTVLLGCEHIELQHGADLVYRKYQSVLEKWNVQQHVIRVVTDSASNSVQAFNLLPSIKEEVREVILGVNNVNSEQDEEENQRLPALSQVQEEEISAVSRYFAVSNLHLQCPVKTLQLAIKDAMNKHDNIHHLLLKAARLVESVNAEDTDQLGEHTAVTSGTSQWSGQLQMIQSLLQRFQKDPSWQNGLKFYSTTLSQNEVRQLTHLANVLAPLADLNEKMQKELGNLGMILPAVTEIKSLLTSDSALPMGVAAFAETLANNVSARYRGCYTDKHLILASLLDPRFKTEWIIRDESLCSRLGEFRDLLIEESEIINATAVTPKTDTSPPSPPDPQPEPKLKQACLFGSYFSEQQYIPGDSKSEVEKYIFTMRQKPDTDVIQFWKECSASFPRLAKVARVVFSVPSGSAGAERVYSAAGLLSRRQRKSLDPQTLAKLIFLNVNSKEL